MVYFLSLFLTVLLNAVCSSAAPFFAEKKTAALDTTLFQTLKLMSQYASAAYCPSNFNSPNTHIKCASGTCPLVEQSNATTTLEYSKTETLTDVTGFVALDHSNTAIIISFRGSQSIDNWLTNLNFGLIPTDLCTHCTAHAGFWQSWLDARDAVLPAVQAAKQKYPAYSVKVTGHSLGGAVAVFAAGQLRNQGMEVALYTFGAPRVGGAALSSYITSQRGGNYRVTHLNDPVPKLPLLVMGYVHISPEYYVGAKNGVEVKPGDFKMYEGAVNLFKGNAAWLFGDVEAHGWYLSRMECSDSKRRRGVDGLEMLGGLDVVARF